MYEEPDNVFEIAQARLMADLTLQMEKFCQVKEQFFSGKFELSPSEFRCLKAIRENPGISTKELANVMELSPGRITHLLNSLEVKNMVIREIVREDRRIINVRLNELATSFVDNVIEEYVQLHREILAHLPASRRVEILNNMKFFFMALKDWASKK